MSINELGLAQHATHPAVDGASAVTPPCGPSSLTSGAAQDVLEKYADAPDDHICTYMVCLACVRLVL